MSSTERSSSTRRSLDSEYHYSLEELAEQRRSALWSARNAPKGSERNQYRQIALSLRALLRNKKWLLSHKASSAACKEER